MLERATAKDLETRYRTMDQLVHDLEEVPASESARSGGATGEATAILSQLPASIAGRRWRRRTLGLALVYVAIAAVVAVVAALLVNGESQQNEPVAPGDLRAIALERVRRPRVQTPRPATAGSAARRAWPSTATPPPPGKPSATTTRTSAT